jgi:hypothetical protein
VTALLSVLRQKFNIFTFLNTLQYEPKEEKTCPAAKELPDHKNITLTKEGLHTDHSVWKTFHCGENPEKEEASTFHEEQAPSLEANTRKHSTLLNLASKFARALGVRATCFVFPFIIWFI